MDAPGRNLGAAPTRSIIPDGTDVPWQGGIARSPGQNSESADLRITLQRRDEQDWHTVVADRGTGAHYVGSDVVKKVAGVSLRTDVRHYLALSDGERVFGLGNKAGGLECTGATQ